MADDNAPTMRVLPAGDRGILLEFDDLAAVMSHHAALLADPPTMVEDIVPAGRTILLSVADPHDLPTLTTRVRHLRPREANYGGGEVVSVPVRYDGPDLAEAAASLGVDTSELVRRHTQEQWTVAFGGFAPGFGYLVGSTFTWDIPRRPAPRTSVPRGSVALAGEFSGIYPQSSPGGWQLIGTTSLVTFDLERDPPALLRPGVSVQFVAET